MGDRRLDAARRLHALARTGLHFCAGEYDRERYEQIERIAAELLADGEPASRAGARALVTRGGIRHAQDRRARRSVPRRRGAPGPRALRRSLDASRRLGRRGRDALAGRDARDRAGIGHPEPGDSLAALLDRRLHGPSSGLFHSWKAFFLCEMLGGEPRGSYETDAAEFFDVDRLPPMSLGRSTPRRSRGCRALAKAAVAGGLRLTAALVDDPQRSMRYSTSALWSRPASALSAHFSVSV